MALFSKRGVMVGVSAIPAAALVVLMIMALSFSGPMIGVHVNPVTYTQLLSSAAAEFDTEKDTHDRPVRAAVDALPTQTDDVVLPFSGKPGQGFPMHLVRYYRSPPIKPNNSLCWMECVSLLSMMTYIKPQAIYVHTNYPDFWPFDSCESLIQDWSTVKLVYNRRRFTVNGKRLNSTDKFIAHEADVAKLIILHKYGGIASDLDVFFLPNITDLLGVLDKGFECIIAKEETWMRKMNAGFVACQRGSAFIRDILEAYRTDYRAGEWVYNSGEIPWKIYTENPAYERTVYVDNEMINHPGPDSGIWKFIYGPDRPNWRKKPGYHSIYHDCRYDVRNATSKSTGFAELLSFILEDATNRTVNSV